MATAQKQPVSSTQLDQHFQKNITGSVQQTGNQDFQVEQAIPQTAETHLRSDELKAVGAKSVGDDSNVLAEVSDVIGSQLKAFEKDITGGSSVREGRAKRFLTALKGRLLRKAQDQTAEVLEVKDKPAA